jgi:hypothetical protein
VNSRSSFSANNGADMWSRQYLQQQNQIAAQNMNPNPFPLDGYVNLSRSKRPLKLLACNADRIRTSLV